MERYVIVPAPSVLGLRPTGVQRLPEALLDAGLAGRLDASVVQPVLPGPYDPSRGEESGFLNADELVRFTRKLADAVEDVVGAGGLPVVLGGDCSILLGNLLALRRRGRFGLLFVDGHADFYQPDANVNGEAASSELALATGRGPETLTSIEGYRPLVYDRDVVVIGHRDAVEAANYGSQPLPDSITAFDLPATRRAGPSSVGGCALAQLHRPDLDGFWVHLDVDVLDDAIMPAVDYRQPGGLSWAEAADVLAPAMVCGGARGIDVTIFNPSLDPDGHLAQRVVELLVTVLDGKGSR